MGERISSKTLKEKVLKLAEGMPKQEGFGAKMFNILSEISELRLIYIQNYSDYSVDERVEVSELIEQIDKFYDDQLQIARNQEYHRLIDKDYLKPGE